MRLFLITILLLISTKLVIADVIAKDKDTATITTSQDIRISDLQEKIETYKAEKEKCNAQWDGFIAPVQDQIDQAAQAGVANAIPLSTKAQAEIFEAKKVIYNQTLKDEKFIGTNWSDLNVIKNP